MKQSLALVFFLAAVPAFAQDNCVERFSGDWMVRLNTGQTYVGHHLPNGVATADCAMCAPGRWTCQGNIISKKAGWISYSGTLSADGNTIVEPYGVLTRIGPAPGASAPTADAPTADVQTPTVRTPAPPTANVQTPTVRTPTAPVANVQTPTVRTPTVRPPTVRTPAAPTANVQTPTVRTPQSAADAKRCGDARAYLAPFASGMGEQWVRDQLATMKCS